MWVLLFLACGEDAKEEGPISGTVTATTGESATASAATAFGVNAGGKAAIVVSPNPATTCEDVSDWLVGSDEDFNPEVVNGEGVCTLYLHFDDYTGTEISLTDDDSVSVTLNCAMDSGAWEYQEIATGYEGYFYSGPWWVGSPEGFSLSLSGGDEADLALSLDMDTYYGRFPYDGVDPEEDLASGAVSGAATATWCPELAPILN